MKKLIVFFLLAVPCFAQTFTVSGHLFDPSTSPSTTGTIVFTLTNTGDQPCRVSGTAVIVPTTKTFSANGSGVFSGTLYRNDFIVCGTSLNTQWQYIAQIPGSPQPPCVLAQVVSTSLNIDSTACSNTVPVVAAGTGDTTYCRLDGTNCGFTGPITSTSSFNFSGNGTVGGTLGVTGAATLPNINGIINAGSYATFALALAACPNPGTLSISSAITVSANASVPATCTLQFAKPGVLNIATATTVTINSAVIAPEDATIFSLTGTGTVAGLKFTRPEWFGGTTSAAVNAAYNSLSSSGGKIQFRSATYVSPWISHATEITKINVELAGVGQPEYNSQTAPTALTGGGTIIQGPVWVMSDQTGTPANGFFIHDLGIDSGSAVCTALFAGVAQQGVFVNNNFNAGSAVGPPFIEGVVIKNVTTLGQSSASAVHSILVDNGDGTDISNVRTFFNIYGVVVKGQRFRVDGVFARGHSSQSVYIKSDTTFGQAIDNSLANVRITEAAAATDTGGVRVESQGVNGISGLTATNITVKNAQFGFEIAGTVGSVTNVVLSNFYFDNLTAEGITLIGTTARATISNGIINSTAQVSATHGIVIGVSSTDTIINNVYISTVGNGGDGINNSGTRTSLNGIQVVSAAGWGVHGIAGSMSTANITGASNGSGLLSNSNPLLMTNGYISVDLTAQTAAIGTTTINTPTLAGQYRLTWDAKVTAAATGAATSTLGPMTIAYTDPDGVAISQVVAAMANGGTVTNSGVTNNNTLTILIGVPLLLNVKAGTAITYAFAYASNNANTMAYNLHIKLEAL